MCPNITMIPILPQQGGPRVPWRDHRCSSEIGDALDQNGRRPFTLRIRVFLNQPTQVLAGDPAGRNRRYIERSRNAAGGVQYRGYNCWHMSEPWLANAFSSLTDSVNVHWNGKLWLRARLPTVPGLSCRIELERVQTAAESNLHIMLLGGPTEPDFRSNCDPGGSPINDHADMRLTYPQRHAEQTNDQSAMNARRIVRTSERDPGTGELRSIEIPQNTFAHELGHYLALEHSCQHLDPNYTFSGLAYCQGRAPERAQRLMASGNEMHPHYAAVWLNRRTLHHYHCEDGFDAQTV